ncbi:unnamed protein product [Microthlaspi erraticum]|uniref:Uncharacterized protein n=1 Tax=Microthlaspi erraticum TaxID=1685480 RepID=A0A6D2IFI7_9BRAS|nr:unnamed protein product [Microthlaspi erraticum]
MANMFQSNSRETTRLLSAISKEANPGKYLDSQRRMRRNLLSFGAGQLVLRTKLIQEGGDDMIMPSTRDMELEAELEPDGAKHVDLEPDGIKDMKLEVEEKLDVMDKLVANQELAAEKLVSKDIVAAPMELVTHSGVNIEPRWRIHDPKPPWFLIQAQEISKWACDSFALFFPYLWFCPNGFSKGRFYQTPRPLQVHRSRKYGYRTQGLAIEYTL